MAGRITAGNVLGEREHELHAALATTCLAG